MSIAPWNSVRVFLEGSAFAANILVMAAVVVANIFLIRNAFDLTSALAIIFFCWSASNSLAIVVARQLQALEQSISTGPLLQLDQNHHTQASSMKFALVADRAYLAEWNHMIVKYNAIVTQANVLLDQMVVKNREAALTRMASQVAHDIGSPLAALNVTLADTSPLPEETRSLLRSAVHRIQDISHQLLERRRALAKKAESGPVFRTCLLAPLVDSVISEKRTQHRYRLGVQIEVSHEASGYGAFALIDPTLSKSVLSNLLNNAVESSDSAPRVRVIIQRVKSWTDISIIDNGTGIPGAMLSQLGIRIATLGKAHGNGLGIYHATLAVESWKGRIHFCSSAESGTIVRIRLPQVAPPPWFIDSLSVRADAHIVIMDDDVSIHNIWHGRFHIEASKVTLHHVSTPDDLKSWVAQNGRGGCLFLLDYELLGFDVTGIALALELDIAHQAALVTSRFEEPEVLQQCINSELPILPKSAAPLIPIRVEESLCVQTAESINYIVIDDDVMFRHAWAMRAEHAKKKVRCYLNAASFFQDAPRYPKATPIYIDSDLGYAQPGEMVAKTLKGMGFDTVILSTGYSPSDFAHCTWLDGVIGKAPAISVPESPGNSGEERWVPLCPT